MLEDWEMLEEAYRSERGVLICKYCAYVMHGRPDLNSDRLYLYEALTHCEEEEKAGAATHFFKHSEN